MKAASEPVKHKGGGHHASDMLAGLAKTAMMGHRAHLNVTSHRGHVRKNPATLTELARNESMYSYGHSVFSDLARTATADIAEDHAKLEAEVQAQAQATIT